MSLKKKEPIFRAGINNAVLGGATRLLTYLNYAIVAYLFGSQGSTDIFYLGLSFATLCTGLFTIVIISVFSPILVKIVSARTLLIAREFAGSILSYLLLVAFCFTSIILIFSVRLFALFSHYSISMLAEHQFMLMMFGVIVFLNIINELFRVYIQSLGIFTVAALIALIQAVTLIIGLVSLASLIYVNALVVSLIISSTIQLFLFIYFCKKYDVLPILNLSLDANHIEMVKVSSPLFLAHLITLSATYYFDFSASGLKAGILTANTFAQRLYALPALLVLNPILEIINTKFSEYYHIGPSLLYQKYVIVQKTLMMLFAPFMLIFILYSFDIVRIFFLRGSFGLQDVKITSDCLAILSISMMSNCWLQINARIFFTMRKTGWTSFWGSIGFLSVIFATHLFVSYFGYLGIPMGRVVVELLYFVPYSFIFMKIYMKEFSLRDCLNPALLTLGVAVLSVVPMSIWFYPLTTQFFQKTIVNQTVSQLLPLSLTISVSLLVYYYLLSKLSYSEIYLLMTNVKMYIKNVF